MRVVVTEHYRAGRTRVFEGPPVEVSADLAGEYGVRGTPAEQVARLDALDAYSAAVTSDDVVLKSETGTVAAPVDEYPQLLRVAEFLAGRSGDPEAVQAALLAAPGDPAGAALRAAGLPVDDDNRASLRRIAAMLASADEVDRMTEACK